MSYFYKMIILLESMIYGSALGLILTNLSSNNFIGYGALHHCGSPQHFLITVASCVFVYYIHIGRPSS